MKVKKISINDLENLLSEDKKIENILTPQFDTLRSDELEQSYYRGEDKRLNMGFNRYKRMREEEFRQLCKSREEY